MTMKMKKGLAVFGPDRQIL